MNTKLILFISLFVVAIFSLDVVKNVLSKEEDKNVKNKEFTIEANIELAPGDVNNNSQIDAGDIVRFTYTITNTTDQAYSYATLKTNVDRKQLNFIHNVSGTTGLSDLNDTITIPNIRVDAQEQREISFDARINYFQEDKIITTEPEFANVDKKSIKKSFRKEIQVKKLTAEEVKKRVEKGGI
jgi:hypothetical protein